MIDIKQEIFNVTTEWEWANKNYDKNLGIINANQPVGYFGGRQRD